MKSIIIIIAILLGTLTAKTDWVKNNGLEYLQISDSNFSYSKVNDSSTKIFTLSVIEKKMRVWDLTTGKLIREASMPYKYNSCDYDFENDIFYFALNDSSDPSLPKKEGNVVWSIDKNNLLESTLFHKEDINSGAHYNGVYFLSVIKNDLYLCYGYETLNSGLTTFHSDIVVKKNNSSTFSTLYKGGEFSYMGLSQNGLILENGQRNGTVHKRESILFITNYGNMRSYYKDQQIGVNFPPFTFMTLDINYGFLCVLNGTIKYLSIQNKNISPFMGKYPSGKIKKFKLVNSIKNSVYYRGEDSLFIYDNELGIDLGQVNFKYGELSYNDSNKILYSHSENKIYRTSLQKYNLDELVVAVDKHYYFISDTIKITSFLPESITDVKYEINGKVYLGRSHNIIINDKGSYSIKISYLENGILKNIIKANIIKIVERFKPKLKVTSDNQFMVGTPIRFACTSNYNDSNIKYTLITKAKHAIRDINYAQDVKSVSISDIVITGNSVTYSFNYLENYAFNLICDNGYEKVTLEGYVNLKPKLSFDFSQYTGKVPFTTSLNSSCYAPLTYGPKFIESTWIIIPIISNIKINSSTFTIDKPGSYPINFKVFNYNLSGTYTFTTNKVLKVLDTTIFQAFPVKFRNSITNNKYAMTQDADGYYMEFGNEEVDVEIYDNVGRLIKSYHIKDEQYIRKEDLERGVYFLQINVNGEVYHEKVLVE